MASLRETKEVILAAYSQNEISDEEFLLLYDINSSTNFYFPYQKYQHFELDLMTDDECFAEFRFYKNDIYRIAEVLAIPEEIICSNRSVFNGIESFCVFLKRFAYPSRYLDLIPRFGRSIPKLCMMSNVVMNGIFSNHHHLLKSFNQNWLAPNQLERYALAIHNKGAPLDFCWGFVDGTVRPVCRPGQDQQVLYNGHKRVHSIKFQSVVAPNGLIANLFGPVEGCRHDSSMLASSNLYNLLLQNSVRPNGDPLCIYGDLAYPLRTHLQTPYSNRYALNPEQKEFNKAMSKVRSSVEWVFGEIINYFAFLDFKKK
ncbi:uncharacterized protein LOC105845632 isoform X2 [Hydra vulgaris]|uniref:Uncharacterized protein LOC105845632 isoform X2 n=1 Tax=Hydra vulgaris TaxID=6087 RepID=A0ABM4C5Q2_HYDVU